MKTHRIAIIFLVFIIISSCSGPLDWPESPLYNFTIENDGDGKFIDEDIAQIKKELVGHYAHFDVVAYEDTTTRTTMRTFIISYGFTDFYLEDGRLMQSDRFVHAEQKLSRKNAYSSISAEAVRAIKPRVQEVSLKRDGSLWKLHRPATPSLLGVDGDPSLPLTTDPFDPLITDPDNDGSPGVTVKIGVGNMMEGEIYIIRREIFSNYLQLNPDGTLSGYVVDESEQFVVGASKKILNQPSNSIQHSDMGLSQILLVPIDEEIDIYEELLEIRDDIFPEEPTFY